MTDFQSKEMKCKIKLLQEYEKELKKAKSNAAQQKSPAPVNMLESSYSRTFIFASNNSSKKINVKQVGKYNITRKA